MPSNAVGFVSHTGSYDLVFKASDYSASGSQRAASRRSQSEQPVLTSNQSSRRLRPIRAADGYVQSEQPMVTSNQSSRWLRPIRSEKAGRRLCVRERRYVGTVRSSLAPTRTCSVSTSTRFSKPQRHARANVSRGRCSRSPSQ